MFSPFCFFFSENSRVRRKTSKHVPSLGISSVSSLSRFFSFFSSPPLYWIPAISLVLFPGLDYSLARGRTGFFPSLVCRSPELPTPVCVGRFARRPWAKSLSSASGIRQRCHISCVRIATLPALRGFLPHPLRFAPRLRPHHGWDQPRCRVLPPRPLVLPRPSHHSCPW